MLVPFRYLALFPFASFFLLNTLPVSGFAAEIEIEILATGDGLAVETGMRAKVHY